MNNIKYAVDSIIKKVFIFIIIVLQITICTILILPTISTSLKLSDSYYRSKELYKDKNIYKVISPTFEKEKEFQLKAIIDCGIMEFFGNEGTIYAAVEAEETVLQKPAIVENV